MAAESQVPAADAPAAKVDLPEAIKPAVPPAVEVEKAMEEPETKTAVEEPDNGGPPPKEEPVPETKDAVEEPDNGDPPPKEEPVDPEKKALDELKQLLSAAIANKEFSKAPPAGDKKPHETKKPEEGDEPHEPKKLEGGDTSDESEKSEEGEEKQEEESKKVEEETKLPEEEEPTKPEELEKVVVESEKLQKVEEEEKQPAKVEEELVKPEDPKEEEPTKEDPPEEITLWGVPLHEEGDRLDTILLKFLRARELKVKDALTMIKETVAWRKSFGIDGLLEEDLGVPELHKAVFMHGLDRDGHPVCYNVYGELEDKDVFLKAFGDEEKRTNFLRWRVQFLEKGITELLDFSAGGVNSMVQVNDLKGAPWLWRKEIRVATKHALHVLQDNYPEFVANQVFINVPWWYLAFNRMMSPFLAQRTKSKFIFAGPSRSAEILFKYIAPEQVPVQFGGLSKENDQDFSNSDVVVDVAIKPSSKQTIPIPVPEPCTLVWELRVLGWDVSYGAEFVPDAEDGYTIIVQKSRKLVPTDEPVEKNSYKIGEPGKIILTIDNQTSKKKKLLYRYKSKSSHDSI